MNILAVGDFHGELPKNINKVIIKNNIDFVLSNGDYFPFHYRKIWFKHCYGTEKELWEVIGKKKYKKLMLKDLKDGEKAIKMLNSVKLPVITTSGNIDYVRSSDIHDQDVKKSKFKWDNQNFFLNIIKKYENIIYVLHSYSKIGDYIVIGACGGTNPGDPTSKAFKRHKKIIDSLFKKFNKNKIIFLSHNVPYNTRLDKISMKAHQAVRGKHYGSKLVRGAIERWKPILNIGGHIHEGRGVDKIGNTVCVNPGAIHEKQAAIINIIDEKVKVKMIKV